MKNIGKESKKRYGFMVRCIAEMLGTKSFIIIGQATFMKIWRKIAFRTGIIDAK